MQRIAALVLCAASWSSNASAQGCTTIADIVGGFAGGASVYELIRNIGPITNWISAGLYRCRNGGRRSGRQEICHGRMRAYRGRNEGDGGDILFLGRVLVRIARGHCAKLGLIIAGLAVKAW
jgi:hypothetical protein